MFCFLAFALAFAIKVPIFPLHTWLPDAHVEAPTGGSVILAGVLLKFGTYGFLRFALPMFPLAAAQAAPVIVILAVIGIVYGALMAYVQDDAKKLVAYSSVSHLGFVVLGIFTLTPAGIQGGIYQMLAHGISTGGLFFAVGLLYDRRHTRRLADFGGLWAKTPVFAALFLVIVLASVGLPGLCGFVGEFLVLIGTFTANKTWAARAHGGLLPGAQADGRHLGQRGDPGGDVPADHVPEADVRPARQAGEQVGARHPRPRDLGVRNRGPRGARDGRGAATDPDPLGEVGGGLRRQLPRPAAGLPPRARRPGARLPASLTAVRPRRRPRRAARAPPPPLPPPPPAPPAPEGVAP